MHGIFASRWTPSFNGNMWLLKLVENTQTVIQIKSYPFCEYIQLLWLFGVVKCKGNGIQIVCGMLNERTKKQFETKRNKNQMNYSGVLEMEMNEYSLYM